MKQVGLFFAIISTILLLLFKFYVVRIAYTKLPDGNYGELFGPVSYCKNYIYCILFILFILGIVCLFKSIYKTKKQQDIKIKSKL
jgi:formate hydrogenlyase subunit 3/multisubunit Na+/H+ antiporter MnhD subunit